MGSRGLEMKQGDLQALFASGQCQYFWSKTPGNTHFPTVPSGDSPSQGLCHLAFEAQNHVLVSRKKRVAGGLLDPGNTRAVRRQRAEASAVFPAPRWPCISGLGDAVCEGHARRVVYREEGVRHLPSPFIWVQWSFLPKVLWC